MLRTHSFAPSVPSAHKLSRRRRTGGIKAALLAILVCMGGIVGAGVYFKAKEDGKDPLAVVKEKWDGMTPAAMAADSKKAGGALAKAEQPGEEEPKTKPEPKTDPPKAETKTEPKKAETKKTEPAKGDKDNGYTDEQKLILNEIRGALSERQLPVAKEKLTEATKMDGPEPFKVEVERLSTLHDYLVQFWKGVDDGGKRVHQLDEITIGSTVCSVVEYANETLVIRVDGVNKRYHLSDMGLKMSLVLAAKALKTDAAVNKVIVGAFLAMDKKGDKEQARKYWEEGKKAGIETASLMPELAITGPKQLNVPTNLTPAMKSQLTLANWLGRREKNGKYATGPLPPLGRPTPLGQLAVVVDTTQTDKMQVINRRRLGGDFTFRMILDDVKEGQVCGLFSADGKEASHFVALPLGTVHIEFSRKGDKFECNLNGTMVEVEHSDGAPPNLAGMAGVSLIPGSNFLIAYFEFLK